MDTNVALLENSYIDAKEFFLDYDGPKLQDDDVLKISHEYFINMAAAAVEFVKNYGGSCQFIFKLQADLVRKGSLSLPQSRAALNVLRDEIKTGKIEVVRRTNEGAPVPIMAAPASGAIAVPPRVADTSDTRLFECWTCGKHVRGWVNLTNHKDTEHVADVMDTSKGEKTFLDISSLPDGRYACAAPDGDRRQFIYLSVKTLKSGVRRDRRFRFGKIVTGREYVPAGTVEVREWSQDAKRLCGMQRPGEGYEGEYVDQLISIISAPQIWAMIFSKFIGSCSICGKTLTDDTSREIGIGPECERKWGRDYWSRFKRVAPAIGGLVTK